MKVIKIKIVEQIQDKSNGIYIEFPYAENNNTGLLSQGISRYIRTAIPRILNSHGCWHNIHQEQIIVSIIFYVQYTRIWFWVQSIVQFRNIDKNYCVSRGNWRRLKADTHWSVLCAGKSHDVVYLDLLKYLYELACNPWFIMLYEPT